ncbi:hypothetical protein SAMN04488027_10974 [Psychroflexus sediminis]|uniref:von Willebrand factor type A domain-containing protein n=1 Tax=Psychroflexus sediminis TaxID=470826 RepID=A0A1G7XQX6_9FLAO|nr:hypothetical protein SAMN04488027_10974 [Psychroflexus sediminis]
MTSQLLLLLFLNFACALALTLILYRNILKDKIQRVLALFRFLSFFLLGLLLINPEIEVTSYSLEKPKLVFAVDNSESIKHLSDPSEINSFVEQLRQDKELNESYDMDFIKFGSDLKPLSDTLSFNETSTNISKAITYANTLEKPETTFALITDGNQTLGEDYNFKSFNSKLSSNILVVGDTTSFKDTKIDLVNVNNYAYLKNKFPVEVFVSQNSSESTNQTLKVSQDGKIIKEKTLEIPSKGSVRTEFLLSADAVGIKVLKVELEPLSEEKNKSNNHKKAALEVIDSRSKILLLSDLLHPDIGFFNRVLETSKALEFDYKSTDEIDEISEYDLVIFYQPQASSLNLINQAKDNSINHFIIGGSHTDYSVLNSLNLGFQKELILSTEAYTPILNPDFSLFLVNNLNFNSYPPLKDKFGDVQLNQNYSVLLKKQLNGIEIESPLWIFNIDKTAKQSILFGENIWRWRAKYFVENSSFTKFDQTFQKIIQFLAQSKSKNTIRVNVKPIINSGENQFLKVKYYNENFESDTRFDFDIKLENSETGEVKALRLLKGEEDYMFDLSKLEPGNYSYKIQSPELKLTKEGSFQVLKYSSEMQLENADIQSLRKLVSAEKLFTFSNRSKLISTLKAQKPKPIQKSIIKSQSLIDFEWLILLLALTLSLEWFFRKYKGLI